MKGKRSQVWLIFMIHFLAIACSGGGGGSDGSSQSVEVDHIEMKLQVDLEEISTAQQKAGGLQSDVSSVMGELSSEDGFSLKGIQFSKNEASIWETETLSLPSKSMLSLSVSAYNDRDEVLFTGALDFVPDRDLNLIVPVKSTDSDLNQPPVISSIQIPSEIGPGQTVSIIAHAEDADGDAIQYLWNLTSGNVIGTTTGNVLEWQAPQTDQAVELTFTVFDGSDQSKVDLNLNVGYQGQSYFELVFLPVVTGFNAHWISSNVLQVTSNIDYDDQFALSYSWKNKDGEILSEIDVVNLDGSSETISAGLELEVAYTHIDASASFTYELEQQVAPLIEYLD